MNAFFIAWALSVVHALLRKGRTAWVEQLGLAGVLFIAVPLINLATPWSLGVTLAQGDWTLAGFDLTCLGAGLFLGWAAWKMQRAGSAVSVKKTPREKPRPITLEQEVS